MLTMAAAIFLARWGAMADRGKQGEFEVRVALSRSQLRAAMAAVMLVLSVSEVAPESVTMTTYYPAPSGVYTQMITTQNTYLARDGGNVGVGTASPKSWTELDVNTSHGKPLRAADATYGGLELGSNGPNIQARDPWGNNMHLSLNPFGANVGVGTMSPASALSVNGSIQPGGDTSACTVPKQGSIRWNGTNLETCTPPNWIPTSSKPVPQLYASVVTGGSIVSASISCPLGTLATGGGIYCAGNGTPFTLYSYPSTSSQWYGTCCTLSNAVWGTAYPVTIEVFIICI